MESLIQLLRDRISSFGFIHDSGNCDDPIGGASNHTLRHGGVGISEMECQAVPEFPEIVGYRRKTIKVHADRRGFEENFCFDQIQFPMLLSQQIMKGGLGGCFRSVIQEASVGLQCFHQQLDSFLCFIQKYHRGKYFPQEGKTFSSVSIERA